MWWRRKATRPERKALRCSFCNRLQDEVRELIAGPRVFICDKCVEVCNDILADARRFAKPDGKQPNENTGDAPVAWQHRIQCALCRIPISANEAIVVSENCGMLCAGCVDAVKTMGVTRAPHSD